MFDHNLQETLAIMIVDKIEYANSHK